MPVKLKYNQFADNRKMTAIKTGIIKDRLNPNLVKMSLEYFNKEPSVIPATIEITACSKRIYLAFLITKIKFRKTVTTDMRKNRNIVEEQIR